MNVIESLRVALGALMTNKLRAALTMLGIIIGVAAVIILVSVGRGFQKSIESEFNDFGSNLLFIASQTPGETPGGPPDSGTFKALGLSNEDAEALRDPFLAPSILQVAPIIQRFVHVVNGNLETDTFVIGVTPETAQVRNWDVIAGRYISEQDIAADSRVVVLGQTVVDDIFEEDEFPLDATIRINNVAFRVVGILEEKGVFLGQDNDDIVVIPLTTAQRSLFNLRRRDGEPEVDAIQVSVTSEADVEPAIQQITAILRDRHDITFRDQDDFAVVSQEEFLAAFEQITGALTAFLGVIAGISLLVGGIGIMNIMLVSVTERTREIGLRKAVGARFLSILTQFLIESMVLSVLGGLIGVVLGFAGSKLASALVEGLTTSVELDTVLMATLISAFIGMFFGIYPAWRAARLNPIDALRFE